METVGVVQARMGASRLPNKMLLTLKKDPIIKWVLQRISKSKRLDAIVVAIPDSSNDRVLQKYVEELGFKTFVGSEDDVLNRFYSAAKMMKAKRVVRICADNPLIDGAEIDNLVEFFLNNRCDYAYNHIPLHNNYPDGLGAEIVDYELLELIEKNAKQLSQREHIFNFIKDNPERFVIKTFDPPNIKIHDPSIRLDIDSMEDYLYLSGLEIDINMNAESLIELIQNGNT